MNSDKPTNGPVTEFLREKAPAEIREAVLAAGKHEILHKDYPYRKRMPSVEYEESYGACQLELVKMQRWMRETGQRIVVIFEGRDAAGKGGAIQRVTENLNPRVAPVVALPAPSDRERGQWYFQRYVDYLPSSGEMVLLDRSWYNRGVVEKVFGFCTETERDVFFRQLPAFERMLCEDGMILIKLWLAIGRSEQVRRFLSREANPLKQWKLSTVDVEGLDRWDDYTAAIAETLTRSHTSVAPWTVILAEDKRRSRIAVMQAILDRLDYPGKKAPLPDPKIVGGPDLLLSR